MPEILSNMLLVLSNSGAEGGGKMNILFLQINLYMFFHWGYYIFRIIRKKKEQAKYIPESEFPSLSVSCIHVLMLLVPLFRSFSLLLRFLCSPSLPFTIACNFLSESPLVLLFVLISTHWRPLVKVKPLYLLKDKLLLVGVVLMECFLIPTFVAVAFLYHNKYTPDQYFECIAFFRFGLLAQALTSSTKYLKEIATYYGQAFISSNYIELVHELNLYYANYWLLRALLASFAFYSSYSFFFNELWYLILCVIFARKFMPEILNTPDYDWLEWFNDDDVVDLLLHSNDNLAIDDDEEILAKETVANYETISSFRFVLLLITLLVFGFLPLLNSVHVL